MAFPNPFAGQTAQPQQPVLPRVPWNQNPMITTAGLALLGGRNINEGLANVAATAPAGMAAKSGMQQFMLAQQEAQAKKAEDEARKAQMNDVLKAWPGLSPEQRALFSAQPELFGQYAMSTMGPKETYRPLTDPNERAQFGIPANDPTPYQVGPDNKVYSIGGGGTNVNIDNVGTIPQGYELQTDPATGAKRMAPIPGGPADTSAKDAVGRENQVQKADIVTQDIDRALGKITSAPGTTTGVGGSLLKGIPGTAAADTSALLDTIKANVGFEQLTAMRAASPTGGALGAVSEKENALLQSVLGSVEQSQSAEQLEFNLKRLKNVYLDIIHGPGQGPPRESLLTAPADSGDAGPVPAGLDPKDWQYMTPEQRALFQ